MNDGCRQVADVRGDVCIRGTAGCPIDHGPGVVATDAPPTDPRGRR